MPTASWKPVTFGALVVLMTAALAVGPLSGQSQTELPTEGNRPESRHPEAKEAISRVWSPYCAGFMLEVCSSGAGAALRDSMQDLALQGQTSEEIVAWMIANHGEEYLAMPGTSGVGLFAWLAPPIGVLLGMIFVVLVLRTVVV